MRVRFVWVISMFLGIAALGLSPSVVGQSKSLDEETAAKVGKILSGYRVAEPPAGQLGGKSMYFTMVPRVPVVISSEAMGSSAVIHVEANRQALLITNHHVVEKPFMVNGQPAVILLFYETALKDEPFDPARFSACMKSSADKSDWCQAVKNSVRVARVVVTDSSRDLALLSANDTPAQVTAFAQADMATIGPEDAVTVIGHPKGLLWTLTTGIVSAVRKTQEGTLIQTQAPVNSGNSGGPLLDEHGNLAGIIVAKWLGTSDSQAMPENLNLAIAINDVQAFVRRVAQ